MTTREHLVYHLQELYSYQRDVLPLLDAYHHQSVHPQLTTLLQQQRDGMRGELETLERALNVLGAQYRMERSALAPGMKEASERFRHRMNPTTDQLDVHAVLTLYMVAEVASGGYQGALELAHAIGEQDVITLLEENLHRETEGLRLLRDTAPLVIQDVSSRESREAA